jgi:hypothetical protein
VRGYGLKRKLFRASPICLVQDDDFVPAWRQRHLFLRKHLDLVAHYVDASAAATAAAGQKCTGAAHACVGVQTTLLGMASDVVNEMTIRILIYSRVGSAVEQQLLLTRLLMLQLLQLLDPACP